MANTFVQLPLIRMVDLAISPTEGAVNFHLLQALLHALIQKSHAQSVAVEIHGAEAAKLQEQLKATPGKPSYTIKETVDKSAQGKDQEIYVLQPDTAYQGTSSVAKEKMDYLEEEVNDLRNQIIELRDLPGNLGIIDAVKNFEEKSSTVIDVFHMLALQKRIEAAEEGMVKIASIVEDLIKSPGALAMSTKPVLCMTTGHDGGEMTDKADAQMSAWKRGSRSDFSMEAEPDSILRQLARDVEDIQARLKMRKRRSVETISGGFGEAETEELELNFNDFDIGMSEERLKEVADHVDRLDLAVNEEITRLHNQFTDIEKDFNELLNKIELGASAPEGIESNTCCSAVYQKLVQLEADFADINETSCKLLDDKDGNTRLLEFVVEQMEVLKSVKADREELEEALADKADACAVLRKVSHDQFDNACEELSKGIGEALERLSQQELLWQQALDDIQSEIGNKLDKMDLGPLREFINNKLRLLQDKMKSLAALKREQEAAGTKNKLLRDVNCISCDKEVVMQKEFDLSMRPLAAMVPPHRSMAPYLAYELDALRKQQKSVPGKNMHSFEAAMRGRVQKRTDDHICNRYCGGSHTVTTPHQRVTRLGHFLMQWGPEAQPVLSGGGDKIGSSQRLSKSERGSIVANSGTKDSSKMDQTKRGSKLAQTKMFRAMAEDVSRRTTPDSKKRLLANDFAAERKLSGLSQGSMPQLNKPPQAPKLKPEVKPKEHGGYPKPKFPIPPEELMELPGAATVTPADEKSPDGPTPESKDKSVDGLSEPPPATP